MDQHVGGETLGKGRKGSAIDRTAVCERARRRRRLLSAQHRDQRTQARHRGRSPSSNQTSLIAAANTN